MAEMLFVWQLCVEAQDIIKCEYFLSQERNKLNIHLIIFCSIACLLEHGANTDQTDNEGMSPLLVSSFEGNGEICELLLENAADPDLADQMGRTPLWAASTSGHANVVKLLLFWGCGIDCMDSEGRTVLVSFNDFIFVFIY